MLNSGYDYQMRFAEGKLGVSLNRRTSRKACGPCPDCGGNDRLVVWVFEDYAWCSRCAFKKFYSDNPDETRAAAAQQRSDREKRVQSLRESMTVSVEWMDYNRAAANHLNLWHGQGMTDADITQWGLGYAEQCPTYPASRSLTIPVFFNQGLIDIRHRLLDAPPEEGRYRSHISELVPVPFNLDVVGRHDSIIVMEGEKKSIIASRFGFKNVVGIPGINSAEMLVVELSKLPKKPADITIAFDPGSNAQAEILGAALTWISTIRIADFFVKPDDLLLKYGPATFNQILKQSRKIEGDTKPNANRKPAR